MDSGGTGSRSSRRGFLRHLIAEVGSQVGELAGDRLGELAGPTVPGGDASPPPGRSPAARALPTRGHVTIDDVLAIADACALTRRLDDVRALARRSLRLTLVGGSSHVTPQASWLGDPLVRPAEFVWSGQQEPRCLAGIDLAQVAAVLGEGGPLPNDGALWCFAPPAAGFVSHPGIPGITTSSFRRAKRCRARRRFRSTPLRRRRRDLSNCRLSSSCPAYGRIASRRSNSIRRSTMGGSVYGASLPSARVSRSMTARTCFR